MRFETAFKFLVRRHGCCRLIHHDKVDTRQRRLVQPERFPDKPFDAITCRCLSTVLLGDSEPEAGRLIFRAARQYGKAFVAASPRFFENTIVVGPVPEPLMSTECVPARRNQDGKARSTAAVGGSGRQACTPFGAAPLDDLAARLGGHASAEAVSSGALYFARLVSAFHRSKPWVETLRGRPRESGSGREKGGKGIEKDWQCQ
jgi:hypothetical protein